MSRPPNVLEARFCAWVHEHRLIFWKVARAFAAASPDQDDLVQEMHVQVWRSLPQFRGDAKPSTWIYRICLNTASSWRRSAGRRGAGRHVEPDETTLPPDPGADPYSTAERHDLLASLYAAIRALPEAERSLIILHLDGLSYEEIGKITGMTANHVGVALTRARQRLSAQTKGVANELG